MDQKEAVQSSGATAEPRLSLPSGRCTLLLQENPFLIPEGDDGEKSQIQNHIKEGYLYEVDHAHLPPRTPAQLRCIRVAMVCEKTEVNVAVRFPTMDSLRAFFNYRLRESHPALDEKFVMGSVLATKVLARSVPAEIFSEHKSSLGFWLISSMTAGSCTAKKGSNNPLSEALKRDGMVTWGIRRQVKYLGRHRNDVNIDQNSSSSIVNGVEESQMEEEEEEEEEEEVKIKVKETNDNMKRKRYSFRNLSVRKTKKVKLDQIRKQKQKQTQKSRHIKKNKGRMRSRESIIQRDPKDRWSSERYKLAEQNLLDVMKSKDATFETPILRPQLRAEARKRIGDTGLLDHLLKHMAGKLAPGGQERFRRRHNPDGAMEYWLESADLVDIRRDAGVTDPYWVPPAGWKPGDSPTQDPKCATELKLLKDDISELRRYSELMATKKQLEEELGMLRREFNEITSKERQEKQTITVESNHCDISQKLDQLAASLESSKRDFGYVHVSVETYKEQLRTISDFVKQIFEGKFEKQTPNLTETETARTSASLMVALTDAHRMTEKTEVEDRETKSTTLQRVQDALNAAAGEGETLQLAKNPKNTQRAAEAEEKAAKIQRLRSGFRICKPQGTFLWPNMVPTPPSVSSSIVPPQLPSVCGSHHYHQYQPPPVKPLAGKRAATVTVSTLSKAQNYEDAVTNTPAALVNLNDHPIDLDDQIPLLPANRMPWESSHAYDDTASVSEVGNWLALSNTLKKSASDDSSHG
ncbi:hypothetical protein C2S53_019968 [Perilla frutescens var. hirtella]|uniref:PTC1-like winged helix-turn-helix domain-containing protein n=1 Tax=Perilla frutescens var. hirtella TaxID=608512 RepID=A0AAD4ILB3_PERFH|nr:hypothetical protein C2S53_019968 [Perilla frutescens var. hirtella]